jgi:hypothetical protein
METPEPVLKSRVRHQPSPERQSKLKLEFEHRQDEDAPYKGVKIESLDELYWIMDQHQWSGEFDLTTGTRANFSGAIISGIPLKGLYLHQANLHETIFYDSDLSGAHLERSDLSGADLRACQMNEATRLDHILINEHTLLGDIRWNGTPLSRVNWTAIQHGQELRLGDEDLIASSGDGVTDGTPKTHAERIQAIRNVIRAYQGLGYALRAQNLRKEASQCRLRERRLERRSYFLAGGPGGALAGFGSWLLDVVSGYGEIPARTFGAYVLVIGLFAGLNFILTNTEKVGSSVAPLSWDEALVLSLTSFHGRGFFPGYLQLNDWIARVGATEAVIGLFIELVFIATFSRRFLAE